MTTTTKQKTDTKVEVKPKRTISVETLELPNNPFTFEVLHLVSKQKSNIKKVEVLKKYEDPSLKSILIWNFDESIISLLPEGTVPYSGYAEQTSYSGNLSTKIDYEVRRMHDAGSFSLGNSDGDGRTTIRREWKHFYHFLKGGNDGISKIRRESMFINILEGLHPLEAELICLVKDKKLDTKYKITKDIVTQAYPDIIWGGRS